jgi:hypothetical protein
MPIPMTNYSFDGGGKIILGEGEVPASYEA